MNQTLRIMSGSLVSVLFLLQLTGCKSHGFNRGELAKQIGVTKPEFDEKQIQDAFTKKPNLPKPFKLALYFKASPNETKWKWTDEDKALIEELGKELKNEGLVSELIPIMKSVVGPSDDIKSLRLGAARYQADALLMVGGAGEIDRYNNNWSWTYVLLAPAFFVPGSEYETLFVTNASMWDVRNEFLYLAAEAEAVNKGTYVAAFAKDDKELFAEAKKDALTNLKSEIKKMIQGKK